MKSKKKYNKSITLDYQYVDSPESEQVLGEVYSKLFSKIIQDQKKLREYFSSDLYKKEYEHLSKRKSSLVDFLQMP